MTDFTLALQLAVGVSAVGISAYALSARNAARKANKRLADLRANFEKMTEAAVKAAVNSEHFQRVNREQIAVIDDYRERFVAQLDEMNAADEATNKVDALLRQFYPNLPDAYDMPAAVEAVLYAIAGDGFFRTFGEDAGVKGNVARVIERLVEENELLKGELENTYMKHGHAVRVIQSQSRIVRELQHDLSNTQFEIGALKTAANDDAADADRYCADLARADTLISYLSEMRVASELPPQFGEQWAEFCQRTLARESIERGPGAEIKAAA